MAITVVHRGATNVTTNVTSYTSSPTWTPAANSLLCAFVSTTASDTTRASSVTGHGLTYTAIATVGEGLAGGALGLYAVKAGGSPTSVAVTATWAVARTSCSINEFEVTGHDNAATLGTGVGAVFPQAVVDGDTNTGRGGSLTLTLAAATSPGNRPVACFAHYANELATPRTNWTELADAFITTSPNHGVEYQWRSDAFETSASGSWVSLGIATGIAAEIAEALVAASRGPGPRSKLQAVNRASVW